MSMDQLSAKNQTILWWIASIASSVLCCAILFVLFATYLIDIKGAIKDNDERLNLIREREDRILAEIAMIRKHPVFQLPVARGATEAPTPLGAQAPETPAAPEAAPAPAAPAVTAPPAAAAPAVPPVPEKN